MADERIRIPVEATLSGSGLKQAAHQVDQLKLSVNSVKSSIAGAASSLSSLGSQILAGLAAAQVIDFAQSAIVQFARLERQIASLGLSLRAMGIETDTVLPRARQFLQALQDAGGALMTETVPAFARFVSITRDVDQALAAVKLAADIAESGQYDFAQAAAALGRILQGSVASGARALGIDIRNANGQMKRGSEVLRDLEQLYGNLSVRLSDTQSSLDKMSASWDAFKTELGEALSPLATLASRLLDLAVAGDQVRRFLVSFGQDEAAKARVSSWVQSIREMLGLATAPLPSGSALEALGAFADRATKAADLEAERDAMLKMLEAELDAGREELRLAEAAEQAEKKRAQIAAQRAKDAERARAQAFAEQQRIAAGLIAEQEQREAFVESLDEFFTEYYERRNEIGAEADRVLWDTALQLVAEGSAEWAAIRMKQIEAEYEAKREAIRKEVLEERVAAAQIIKINQAEANAKKAIDDTVTRLKIDNSKRDAEASVMAAQIAVGAVASAYPEIKAFKVAQGLLSVYAAALKAAEEGGPIAYAAVFAALIGFVSEMRSVTPGSGSGAGGSVRYTGAQYGTQTPVRQQYSLPQLDQQGTAGRGSSSGSGGVTINQHITVRGSLIDSQRALRALSRDLQNVERQDRERKVR
jgi:hypothetical protein